MDTREFEDKQAVAYIDKLIAESRKLNEESMKLQHEGHKLYREGMKLERESMKLQRESRWYPVVVLTAMMGIIATLFKTIH